MLPVQVVRSIWALTSATRYSSALLLSMAAMSSDAGGPSAKYNERYGAQDFAYGEPPNVFFQQQLDKLNNVGTILLPADGEGRNGVYAARQGWKVTSFDIAKEGRNKALQLADKHGVAVRYDVGDLETMEYDKDSFDCMALIFAHFPPNKKSIFHEKLNSWVKPGGTVIFEAFSKDHAECQKKNPRVGGPPNPAMMFEVDEVKEYFENYEILQLEQVETELSEGLYHVGLSSVIRFVGRKKG